MLKSRLRITSCFLWVALTMLGFYSPNPARAEIQPGVSVTVYNNYWYNNAPPLPDVSGRPIVGTTVQSQVLNYFDQQPLFNMYEDFIVKYEGFITVPTTGVYQFYAPADDGVKLYLNNELIIDDWFDKGGGGSVSNEVTLNAYEPVPFTLWFYENGGGAWVEFYWLTEQGWEIVPASAFTQTQEVELPTTTTEATTTTSTTSTTTTTEAPQDPPTTTLVSTTTLPPLASTTSSSSTSTVPVTTTSVTSTTLPPETTTSTSTTLPVETTTTTIPVIDESLSPEEAVAIVTSATVLKELSSEEATQVFDSLEVSELTDEQAEALVEAVQDAPEEVRAAFEEEVNIFDNKFNTYVPLGSKINVGQRKVLVAATGVLFMAPTVSVSSSSSSSQSDSRKRR